MKTKLTLILTTALALTVLADDKPKQTDKAPVAPGGGITIKRAAQGTFLGVAMDVVPAAVRAQLNIPAGVGVSVGYVAKNSPAEKAGLKANDVITQLDDQIILNAAQLQGLIQTKKQSTSENYETTGFIKHIMENSYYLQRLRTQQNFKRYSKNIRSV